jgi:hypothetical protein
MPLILIGKIVSGDGPSIYKYFDGQYEKSLMEFGNPPEDFYLEEVGYKNLFSYMQLTGDISIFAKGCYSFRKTRLIVFPNINRLYGNKNTDMPRHSFFFPEKSQKTDSQKGEKT